MSGRFFQYGKKEIDYLAARDRRLGEAIGQIGMIERVVRPDLFTALMHGIVGQQISLKAQKTVWARMQAALPEINAASIMRCSLEELRQNGISLRKASYMRGIAEAVLRGDIELENLYAMPDEAVCAELTKLRGIGVWSAEMVMIFSMQRPNILSYGDLAIQRGLRMLYRRRQIDKAGFAKYRQRYAPFASVASLYLWAIAGGAIEGLQDPAGAGRP